MSRYGYLEVFQRFPWTSRYRESTVVIKIDLHIFSPVSLIELGSLYASRKIILYSYDHYKNRLFKYIEKFTSKNWKFSDKKLIFFIFLLKT